MGTPGSALITAFICFRESDRRGKELPDRSGADGVTVLRSSTHFQFHHLRRWRTLSIIKETIHFPEVLAQILSLLVGDRIKVWKNVWVTNYMSPKIATLNVIKVATTSTESLDKWLKVELKEGKQILDNLRRLTELFTAQRTGLTGLLKANANHFWFIKEGNKTINLFTFFYRSWWVSLENTLFSSTWHGRLFGVFYSKEETFVGVYLTTYLKPITTCLTFAKWEIDTSGGV